MTEIAWLERRLNDHGAPVVIDGGMGTELEKAGVPMHDKVWCGHAVRSHPDAVCRAHEAFIEAGAEVIIANTFATGRHMLERGGLGEYVKEINLAAVALARQARERAAQQPVAIAGSICEWAPPDDPKWHAPDAVRRSAREQAGLLLDAGVDLLVLEMCQEIEFSVAVVEAAVETGLPVWIGLSGQKHPGCASLSVFDYQELSFEPLVRRLAEYPVRMITVMHTPAPDVDEALAIVREHWDGPVGVYPESGHFVMPNWQFVDVITPDELVQAARVWVDRGVRMVGGCCGLGPEHIRALREAFS